MSFNPVVTLWESKKTVQMQKISTYETFRVVVCAVMEMVKKCQQGIAGSVHLHVMDMAQQLKCSWKTYEDKTVNTVQSINVDQDPNR